MMSTENIDSRDNLTEYDYKILDFIHSKTKIHKDSILNQFPDKQFATISRLAKLKANHFICYEFKTVKASDDIFDTVIETGNISVPSNGLRALQDYECRKKSISKKVWENRFWKFAPITISIISLLKSYDFI